MRRNAGCWLWMTCLQFFLAEQIVAHRWTLPYSFRRNYISDLAALHCGPLICSPWHAGMNFSFGLQSVLIAGGALLLWPATPGKLARAGLLLLILSAGGLLAVAIYPEDTNMAIHGTGAAMHFLLGGLGIFLAGLAAARSPVRDDRTPAWLSILVGISILAATFTIPHAGSAVGAVERVAAYGIAGWCMVAGYSHRRA